MNVKPEPKWERAGQGSLCGLPWVSPHLSPASRLAASWGLAPDHAWCHLIDTDRCSLERLALTGPYHCWSLYCKARSIDSRGWGVGRRGSILQRGSSPDAWLSFGSAGGEC